MPLDGMTRRARNVVIANNDFTTKDGTVLTSPTSFVAGMGLSNILNDRLKMVCRTIGNSVILDLDMGYPVPASLFMLLGHNFTAGARWRIRGARARSGAAGDVGGYNFALADTVYDTRGILASGTARGALSWTSSLLDHDLNSGTLPAGCTLTRASPGTYFDYTGTMRTAAANEPRFDYDPATKAPLGLLVEPVAANLLLRSGMDATGSFWNDAAGGANTTITGGTASAPNGATDAGTLAAASTGTFRSVLQSVVVAASTTYTLSIFAKVGSGVNIAARLQIGASAYSGAIFNPSTGAVVAQTDGTAATTSVQQLPNGWWRFSVTATTAAGFTASAALVYLSNGSSLANSVTAGSNAFVWGAQLEAGSVPTSYIATTSATVTRQADVPTMPTSALPFSATASTLVVAFQTNVPSGQNNFAAQISDNTYNNRYVIGFDAAVSVAQAIVSGVVTLSPSGQPARVTTACILGGTFATNDAQLALNGTLATADTSGALPAGMTRLDIGGDHAGFNRLNGWISRITYIAFRVSNPDLQTLTNPATSAVTRAATLAPYAGAASTTPITLGTGSKIVYVTDPGLRLYVGTTVQLAIDAGNYMRGPVTDYDRASGRLTINVMSVVGSGAATSMTITRDAADLSVWPSVDPFGLSYWGDFSWGGQIDLLGEGYSPPGVHMPGLANGDGQPVYARYFKIEVQDTGLSWLDIGRLVVAAAYQPTINMSWDWRIGWVDPSQRERSRGGQVYVDGRKQWRTASLSLANIPRTEMMSQMYELRRAVGVRKPFAIILDPTDAANLHRLAIWGSIPDQTMEISNPQFGDYRTALNVEEHF